jgi:hypothetical protein
VNRRSSARFAAPFDQRAHALDLDDVQAQAEDRHG